MFSYRTAFWGLVALIALAYAWKFAGLLNDHPVQRPSNILVVTGGSGPYWELVKAGAEAAGSELKLDVNVEMPKHAEDLQDQMQILATLNASDWGGIALSPIDAEQQTRLINWLAAGTNVLTFDSDAPLSNRIGYIGTSNYGAGRLCAQLVHEALPDGGKVAILMANRTKANLLDRQSGFEENINRLLPTDTVEKLGSYEIADILVDEGNRERCAELIRQVLTEHPDLACFVGLNSRHGPILLDVLQEEGKLGQVKLVTFDFPEATLQGIEDGHIYATIAQDPYRFGYESVRVLASQDPSEPGSMPGTSRSTWYVPTEVVRKDSVASFRARRE